ncbi:unnamed protein product [Tilletia caries]|uniref:CTLH domain-containing protein n=3 Tax=Tilletia TaxID=13289 RepID=A0A8X7SW93_9BASI|nr:hypothetical protein CF336_g4909 [Tilletia laevis]KAE8195136.1 hypothetical protein CF328_g4534 [Tilletia controversa]KAE8259105.1 hypothetical protein A4X03_0g4192 [Tilletia caries]KAE8199530.1 hypothetical protein CF335_g4151 [Tilletia laevis]KAE8245942.1 hypothetical protein A4X06_0g5310 [Tilletia controversa]
MSMRAPASTSQQQQQQQQRSAVPQPSTVEDLSSPLTLRQLVLNYLLHYSYVETATAFAHDINTTTTSHSHSHSSTPTAPTELESTELDLLAVRKQVRDAILNGEIELAINIINNHFPTVLAADPSSQHQQRTPPSRTQHPVPTETAANAPTLPDNPTSLDPAHLSLNLQIQNFIESVRRASAPGSRSRWESSTNQQQKQPVRSSQQHQHQQAMSSSIHSLASNSSCASASTALSRPTSPALSSVSSSASGSISHQPSVAAVAAAAAAASSSSTAAGPSSSTSNGANTASNGGAPSHRKQGKSAARSSHVPAHNHHHHKHQNSSSPASSSHHHHSVTTSLHLAIAHAQSLYRAVDALPSYWQALYRKELEKVTSLLAYPELEGSPVKQLLHPNRRVALAEQINSAILFRTGRPSQPLIETAARQTTYVWNQLAADRIAVPAGHPLLAQMNSNAATTASTTTSSITPGATSASAAVGLMGHQDSATAGLSSALAALVQATHSAAAGLGTGGSSGSAHPGLGAKSDSRRSAGGSKETGKVLQPWNLSAFLNSR